MVKNPHVLRKLKVENIIDGKDVKVSRIMFKNLIDQLQLCSATSSLQILFANPPATYKIFFLTIPSKGKRSLPEKEKQGEPEFKKKKGFGSIINTTGKKIFFPKGMEKRYCADLLDVAESL